MYISSIQPCSGPALPSTRAERQTVIRVVDDFPGYFRIYCEFDIPGRVGLHLSSRHTRQMFFDRGRHGWSIAGSFSYTIYQKPEH